MQGFNYLMRSMLCFFSKSGYTRRKPCIQQDQSSLACLQEVHRLLCTSEATLNQTTYQSRYFPSHGHFLRWRTEHAGAGGPGVEGEQLPSAQNGCLGLGCSCSRRSSRASRPARCTLRYIRQLSPTICDSMSPPADVNLLHHSVPNACGLDQLNYINRRGRHRRRCTCILLKALST